MVNSQEALRAVFLSVVVCLSMFVTGVGLTGGAAAVSGNTVANTSGSATYALAQTAGNQIANPTYTATYPSVGQGSDSLRVNFTSTGADFDPSVASTTIEEVTVDNNPVSVSSVTRNTETVDIELAKDVPSGSDVDVSVNMRGVRNPPTAGNYGFTLDLRDSSADTTDVRAGGTVSIVEGADVSGQVTDADTGAGLSDSSVTVEVVDTSPKTPTVITTFGTDGSGNYGATVPPDADTIRVNSDDYARKSTSISVNNGGTVTQDVALDSGTWVNGTVTDGSGTELSGITVFAERKKTGRIMSSQKTASDGSYSLGVNHNDNHIIVAGTDSSDRELDFSTGVSPSKDTTATVNLTTPKRPGDGTLNVDVTAPDGTAVSGAKVYVRSSDFKYGGVATTDSNGVATLTKPEGKYTIRVEPSNYGSKMVRGVSVNESETTSQSVSLDPATTVSGTVTDTDGTAANGVPVLVSNGEQFAFDTTDGNGQYSVTVSPGNYTVSVLAEGKSAPAAEVSPSDGSPATANFDLETSSVVNTEATITDGPGDDSNLAVGTTLRSGLLRAKLYDESQGNGNPGSEGGGGGKPDDLSTLGVDSSTEFEIRITVDNFNSDALLWGIKNSSWQTEPNGENTDIIINGSTTDIQVVGQNSNGKELPLGPVIEQNPSQINWPTGRDAGADVGVDNTVYFGLYNLSTIPGPVKDNLKGISTTTNAQAFAPPTFENDTLRVWLGAPSKRVEGTDHTGFYQADIPQSQLDDWGVSDPETELRVTYKDSPREYTVTDTDNGARLVITNISYSASYAEIEPNQTAIDSGSDDSSNDGGSSGDSSGGGGATTTTTSEPVVVESTSNETTGTTLTTVGDVEAGQTVSVTNVSTAQSAGTGGNASLETVNITFDTDETGVSVEAGTNGSAVETTGEPEQGETIDYLEIETSAGDESIGSAQFDVRVPDSERERLGVGPENVVVYRYHDGEWNALETTHAGGDQYQVTTPGFSVFAIGTDVRYDDALLRTTTVDPGETVTGAVDVTNTGATEATADLTLRSTAGTISTTTVEVPANTTTSASISGTVSEPGTYQLSINGEDAGTLQVSGTETTQQSGATESQATDQGTDESTGGSGPGFTSTAAVLAVLSLALVLRRRRA